LPVVQGNGFDDHDTRREYRTRFNRSSGLAFVQARRRFPARRRVRRPGCRAYPDALRAALFIARAAHAFEAVVAARAGIAVVARRPIGKRFGHACALFAITSPDVAGICQVGAIAFDALARAIGAEFVDGTGVAVIARSTFEAGSELARSAVAIAEALSTSIVWAFDGHTATFAPSARIALRTGVLVVTRTRVETRHADAALIRLIADADLAILVLCRAIPQLARTYARAVTEVAYRAIPPIVAGGSVRRGFGLT